MALKKGMTMAELLVATGLLGVIALMAATIYVAHFKLFSNQAVSFNTADASKLAIAEIVNQVRQSESVQVNCCSSPTETTTTPTSTVLVLRLLSLDPATGEPILNTYDYIIYKKDASATKLLRRTVANAASSRSSGTKTIINLLDPANPNSLQFQFDPPDLTQAVEVTTTVTTTASYLGKVQNSTKTTKTILRNK